MNKEIIERYIQFAINNWYKDLDWYKFLWLKYEIDHILWEFETANWKYSLQLLWDSILEIITSKKFLEAIARWIYMWNNPVRVKIDNIFNQIIDDITTEQSIAIRDKKLEDFILEILK